MAWLGASRRGYGEDGIYFDHRADCRDSAHHKTCSGRWRGVVSLGFDADGKRIRRKVSGQTTTEVEDKLKALHFELDTKTNRSRRTLKLPEIAVDALRSQRRRQAAERAEAGESWQEHPAPPPHPARPDPRLVTHDGRHHRHHLGKPDHSA